jgi:hypothetical protein
MVVGLVFLVACWVFSLSHAANGTFGTLLISAGVVAGLTIAVMGAVAIAEARGSWTPPI